MAWFAALGRSACALLLVLCSAAGATTVRVGVYANPPKVALAPDGTPSGIYVTVLQAVARHDGLQLQYVPGTFQQGLDRLRSGEIDLMVDVAKTPEREALFDFSREPVLQSWNTVYARRGVQVRNLLQLQDRKVAVLAGSVQEAVFRSEAASFGVRAVVVPYPTYAEAFDAARKGAVDAVVSNPFVGQVSQHGLVDTAVIFGSYALHFAAPRGRGAGLLAAIDRELVAAKADPGSGYSRDFQALVTSQRTSELPDWFWDASATALLALALTTGWAWSARRAARRLAQSEDRQRRLAQDLQRIFDHAPDIICALDGELRVRRVSPAARGLGYEPQQLAGRSVLELVAPQRREPARDTLQRVLAGEPIRALSTLAVRPDGTTVDISCSAVWSAELGEMVCVIHDESERMALLRDAAVRQRELQRANEDLLTVSYSLSHDLRAPLAAIDGFVSAVVEGHGGEARQRGLLERAQLAARRADRMVHELGALLRVAGEPLQVVDCDVSELALEVGQGLQPAQARCAAALRVQPGLRACADPRMLRLLLENLIGNAFKFSAKVAAPAIEFGQSGQEEDAGVFFVRDNGAGFDAAGADRLFRPFTRLHDADAFPGSGMGLTIVQRIVARHGGRVWAEGAPGAGATFYFTLALRCMGASRQ